MNNSSLLMYTILYNEGYTTLQKNSKQYKKVNTKAA